VVSFNLLRFDPETVKLRVAREHRRAYRDRHPERIREEQRSFHLRHRAERLAKMRARRALNPEAERARSLAWYARAKNTPGFMGKRREMSLLNQERHPFRERASRLRYRFGGTITAAELWGLWKAQRGRCALTGEPLTHDAHVDHVIPVARGGRTEKANLRFLSPAANLIKRHFTDEELLDFCAAVILTIGGSHP
jgi:5-methylcytosine-specific restriction endonuclease McrA